MEKKYLIFVFIGEFGYEMMNWHGLIRKLKETCDNFRYIICGRTGLELLYPYAEYYIDISSLKYFRKSIAASYCATNVNIKELVKEIEIYVYRKIKDLKEVSHEFIFSHEGKEINGIRFGGLHYGDIYKKETIKGNSYSIIVPKNEKYWLKYFSKNYSINFDKPYIVIQNAQRFGKNRIDKKPNIRKLISKISNKVQVVNINFNTDRSFDTVSNKVDEKKVINIKINDFQQQCVLIKNSLTSIFETQGDFRSHTYIPPFLGKKIYVYVNRPVLFLGTGPVDMFNKYLFKKLGSEMHIIIEEELWWYKMNYVVNRILKNKSILFPTNLYRGIRFNFRQFISSNIYNKLYRNKISYKLINDKFINID
tara:strand:- start:193 stop:1287 length:1095 start_codon:yes stop_codon:yes gene_type:complete